MSEVDPVPLESPGVHWRIVLIAIAGGFILVLASATLLMVFYRATTHGGVRPVRPHRAPAPALDTFLFRSAPPLRPAPAPAGLEAAMKAVVARGDHAYDAVAGP